MKQLPAKDSAARGRVRDLEGSEERKRINTVALSVQWRLTVKLRAAQKRLRAARAHNLSVPEVPNKKRITDPSNDC